MAHKSVLSADFYKNGGLYGLRRGKSDFFEKMKVGVSGFGLLHFLQAL